MTLTPEQIEARRTGIGGSDVAAVLGISPWRTPLDVYLSKIGEGEELEQTEAMHWGNVLEDVVAQEYARRTGLKLRRRNKLLRHREHPELIANIDREVVGEPVVLEVKTAGRRTDDWGEPGTDEVPPWYAAQCMHYLAVTGRERADLAVLFMGDRQFATYTIPRNDELIERLVTTLSKWWRQHVEARVPPPPQSVSDVKKLWPLATPGKTVTATEELEEVARELARVRAIAKAAKDREMELCATLQKALEDAEALVDPAGRVLATWKTVTMKRLDTKALREAAPEVVEQFEAEQTVRRFLLKVKED